MVKKNALNFLSDPQYSSQLWHCAHCDSVDSQSHILVCDSYRYLREGKDLKSDQDLVKYFKRCCISKRKIRKYVIMTGSYRIASALLSEGRSEEGAQENSGFSKIFKIKPPERSDWPQFEEFVYRFSMGYSSW